MNAHLERAQLLLDQSRYLLAEKELRSALASDPDNAVAHAMLAITLAFADRDKDALEEARHAVHLAPDESYCHFALAHVLGHQEDYDKAIEAIHEAIQLSPEEANYFGLLASILCGQRQWEDALEAAEQGLQCDSENTLCANFRAMALTNLGRHDEASEGIEDALCNDPNEALTHANLGWTLLRRGDHAKATEHFREALRLDPELEWARKGMIESLKARNAFYRVILRYFLWIGNLPRRSQWAFILGAWFGSRIINGLAKQQPELGIVLWPLLFLYFAFVVISWIGHPLSNLFLRLHPFGRLALNRDETMATNVIGGCLLLGLGLLCFGILTHNAVTLFGALGSIGMVIVLGGTFSRPPKHRRPLVIYSVCMACLGVLGLVLGCLGLHGAGACGSLFVIGFVAFSWGANLLVR